MAFIVGWGPNIWDWSRLHLTSLMTLHILYRAECRLFELIIDICGSDNRKFGYLD
jgi:hypothetical protein